MGLQTSLSLYICFFLLSFLKGGTSDFSVTVHLFLSFVFPKRVGLQTSLSLYICFFLLSFLKGWVFRLLCHCTCVSFFRLFLRVGLQTSLSLYICFFLLSFLKGGNSDFSVIVHLFLSFVFSKRWDFRLLCHCTFVSFFCLF